ncbi:hypothetical protein Ami103574_04665 [Aminipila butyrica]|uniref:Uncharacterized protein n=1 Tax=Aminipila butyrica TaxID=433296 RepID=A0A858BUA2_9FIRM|nr:hypothetical protein [Aminipila butyrica]QIB68655.1 hypothetical protein Ami103574_04665 [Aminipila butyrica]
MYEILCYFIIYSFLGWCTEVAYAAVNSGKFINRGFLNGPVCPIYGFGVLLVISCLTPLMDNKILLFLGAVLLTSTLEWLTGFTLEKVFHGKWWDYSQVPFNLNGYICLKFSIIWGLACLLIVDLIHPLTRIVVGNFPLTAGRVVLALALTILLADGISTVMTVNKLNRQLNRLNEIGEKLRIISDELGENIYESVSAIKERSEKLKDLSEALEESLGKRVDQLEQKAEALEESLGRKADQLEQRAEAFREELKKQWKQAYEEELERYFFGKRRMLKAFPDLKFTINGEHLTRLKEKIKQGR